jgi:hypothetical protein
MEGLAVVARHHDQRVIRQATLAQRREQAPEMAIRLAQHVQVVSE